jgi:hypothetical protein
MFQINELKDQPITYFHKKQRFEMLLKLHRVWEHPQYNYS